ncbi:MAG: N-acetylmuramoyl-L-alanine amidase [Clostridia bacterium]|nr:N-acetylmuramoyl-L-alanine amidase [Clostridia bacterium]
MNMLKRFTPQLVLLVIICLVATFGYVKSAIAPTSAEVSRPKTIIIDAGHGGFDGGASASDGTVEKDINLCISQKLCSLLRFYGYDVIMTRESDTGTEDDESQSIPKRKKSDLVNRLQIMKDNPDAIFVSVHLNKFTTSAASGAQVFYTKNYKEAQMVAQSVQQSITSLIQPENTRVVKQGTDSTYLLKNAAVPAIIVECGFLSNKQDLEKLKSDDYQSQMAFAICVGILNFMEG